MRWPTPFGLTFILALGCNAISGIDEYGFARTTESSPQVGDADARPNVVPDSGSIQEANAPDSASASYETDADVVCPTHKNGLGQSFASCLPMGKALALEARAAWPEPGTDVDGGCACFGGTKSCGAIVRMGTGGCAGWVYEGDLVGKVRLSPTCECPTKTDPDWN